jgi:hypothetical protein
MAGNTFAHLPPAPTTRREVGMISFRTTARNWKIKDYKVAAGASLRFLSEDQSALSSAASGQHCSIFKLFTLWFDYFRGSAPCAFTNVERQVICCLQSSSK